MSEPIDQPLWSIPSLKETSVEDLEEQAQEVDYLTPREFGKLRGFLPQQVYQWIRKGTLKAYRCQCGRVVVRVSESDKVLHARKIARGTSLDTRPDQ